MIVPSDFANLDATAFARLVAGASDSELKEAMESERRGPILEEIFGRFARHFRPERATGVDTVMHFRITDRPGGGEDHWEVVIRDGACAVTAKPEQDPGVTITVGAVQFLKLVSGNADPAAAFLQGKLKLQGNAMMAAQVLPLFTLPKA